jgi:co-chaperonin GroES (HSP10)
VNSYQIPGGQLITVVGSGILVERVPVAKVSPGGIFLHNPEKEDGTALGIIRAVGHLTTKKGAKQPIDRLVPGMKCAFLWFYAERHTNQQIRQRIGDDFVFLKWEDIILVWEADEEYRVSDIVSNGR